MADDPAPLASPTPTDDAQMNDINFPAGVLQPPLYDPKMDDAPNYGNTGATIGHELTVVTASTTRAASSMRKEI